MRERLNVMLNYLRENKVNITTNASEELIKKAVTKKLQEENPELEYECPVCGNSIPDVDICPFCGITMLGGENSEETIEPENLDSDIENMEDIIYEEEDVVLPKSQKQDVPAQRQVVTTKLSKEKKEKAISIIKQHNKERAELTKIRLNKERSSRGKRRITEVRKMTSEIVSPEIKTVQYILEKLAENGIGYTETLQRIRITPTIKCAVKCFCQLKTKKNESSVEEFLNNVSDFFFKQKTAYEMIW